MAFDHKLKSTVQACGFKDIEDLRIIGGSLSKKIKIKAEELKLTKKEKIAATTMMLLPDKLDVIFLNIVLSDILGKDVSTVSEVVEYLSGNLEDKTILQLLAYTAHIVTESEA